MSEFAEDQVKPVILIGHSLGGLLLKQVCLELEKKALWNGDDKAENLLERIKGGAFYATPHGGSPELAHLARHAGEGWAYLGDLSERCGSINRDFDSLCRKQSWRTIGFYEKLPTSRVRSSRQTCMSLS
jgi:hypothetical protein